jgi:YegS/Rv2252/BmrU family lipid kinase
VRKCLIFNPKARGQKAEKLQHLLNQLARECHCKPTTRAGEARELAAAAVNEGFETVIAAGGDGTINEVTNGIGDAPDGFSKSRLAVLPMGTINVFARELGIPSNLEQAWQIISRGNEIAIDLPRAEFNCAGKTLSRYFIQLAGAGLDANAVTLVSWELKKKIGGLAYLVAGLQSLGSKQSKIRIGAGAKSFTGELVLIGNGRLYGGNFAFFPQAQLRDGRLSACVFPKVNWLAACRAGVGLVSKNLPRFCGATELAAEELTLTADRKTFLQLDGESVGELPARLSIEPQKLRVVVP